MVKENCILISMGTQYSFDIVQQTLTSKNNKKPSNKEKQEIYNNFTEELINQTFFTSINLSDFGRNSKWSTSFFYDKDIKPVINKDIYVKNFIGKEGEISFIFTFIDYSIADKINIERQLDGFYSYPFYKKGLRPILEIPYIPHASKLVGSGWIKPHFKETDDYSLIILQGPKCPISFDNFEIEDGYSFNDYYKDKDKLWSFFSQLMNYTGNGEIEIECGPSIDFSSKLEPTLDINYSGFMKITFDVNLAIQNYIKNKSKFKKAFLFDLKDILLDIKTHYTKNTINNDKDWPLWEKKVGWRKIEKNKKVKHIKSNTSKNINQKMEWIKKNNHGAMKKVLKNCEKIAKKEKLDFERIYTYDNDFFSKDYFISLLDDEIIIFNERLGKEPNKSCNEIEAIIHANDVKPWYYKDKGSIMDKGFLADVFKVKNDNVIYNKFPKTKELLKMEKYWVHADWSGNYFLSLAALTGSKFNEITLTIEEMNNIREWVLKEKPKGVVISCVGSDKDFPLTDMSFGPILDMFDIPEIDYLKLLFISKRKEGLIDECGNSIMEEEYDGNVEWVIAYVK